MTKELIVDKLKTLITASRGFLTFLRTEDTRGLTRAYLFDSLIKALILIVDDVIGKFEKTSNEKVVNSQLSLNVSFFFKSTHLNLG
jgi:hypothetical protein